MIYLIKNKQNITIYFSLKNIYGLSTARALTLCKHLGYDINSSFDQLTFDDKYNIVKLINSEYRYILSTDLKKKKNINIKLLKKIRTYKGIRHTLHLPVNGQRTKTNAKTQKWKKR